jgi:hypothetical protein
MSYDALINIMYPAKHTELNLMYVNPSLVVRGRKNRFHPSRSVVWRHCIEDRKKITFNILNKKTSF